MLNCEKAKILKKWLILFLIISPKPFKLQRCTISQFKALDLLFWPLAGLFDSRINHFCGMKLNVCQLFFIHPLVFLYIYLSKNILKLQYILSVLTLLWIQEFRLHSIRVWKWFRSVCKISYVKPHTVCVCLQN